MTLNWKTDLFLPKLIYTMRFAIAILSFAFPSIPFPQIAQFFFLRNRNITFFQKYQNEKQKVYNSQYPHNSPTTILFKISWPQDLRSCRSGDSTVLETTQRKKTTCHTWIQKRKKNACHTHKWTQCLLGAEDPSSTPNSTPSLSIVPAWHDHPAGCRGDGRFRA